MQSQSFLLAHTTLQIEPQLPKDKTKFHRTRFDPPKNEKPTRDESNQYKVHDKMWKTKIERKKQKANRLVLLQSAAIRWEYKRKTNHTMAHNRCGAEVLEQVCESSARESNVGGVNFFFNFI